MSDVPPSKNVMPAPELAIGHFMPKEEFEQLLFQYCKPRMVPSRRFFTIITVRGTGLPPLITYCHDMGTFLANNMSMNDTNRLREMFEAYDYRREVLIVLVRENKQMYVTYKFADEDE